MPTSSSMLSDVHTSSSDSGCSRTFLQRCGERARQQEVRFKLHLLARLCVCLYNRSNSHIFAGRFNNNAGNEHLLMRGQVF